MRRMRVFGMESLPRIIRLLLAEQLQEEGEEFVHVVVTTVVKAFSYEP